LGALATIPESATSVEASLANRIRELEIFS
jgi:hypothetical protein